MQRYLIIRTSHALLALFVVTVVVFGLIRASGNPVDTLAVAGQDCNAECKASFERFWGIDRPLHVQYFSYMGNIFKGEFGLSMKYKSRDTKSLIAERLPNSIKLASFAMFLSVLVSVPLGVFSAVKRDTPMDFFGKSVALLGQSLPSFWLGLMMIWIFAVKLGWFPTSGTGGDEGAFTQLKHMILPAVTMGWFQVAAILRLVRSSMLEVLDSEYVKLARIKGIPEWKVVWKHCLRNAFIAPLTYFAIIGVSVLTGALITETVFNWPGVGQLALEVVRARDYAPVQTLILMFAAIYIASSFVVDILYAYLDPRIRYA